MIKEIIITVKRVTNYHISYDEVSWASGCDPSMFPYHPSVGEKFILRYDDGRPQDIVEIKAHSENS